MTAMTLNDSSMWEPTKEQIEKWKQAYQAIDVDRELAAASAWLDSNPTRRKTKRGIARFCNSWLSRAHDKGGSGMAKARVNGFPSRDMTSLDELTHNFTGDPATRQYFIQKYGQCFEDGVRYTA